MAIVPLILLIAFGLVFIGMLAYVNMQDKHRRKQH